MPSLALFVTLAATLCVVLSIIVLLPWLKRNKVNHNNTLMQVNVEVFKQRIEELNTDFHSNKIGEDAFKAQKVELKRQLLQANQDITTHKYQDESVSKPTNSNYSNEQTEAKHISNANLNSKPTHSLKAKLIVLCWTPMLIAMGYVLIADTEPVRSLWTAQDKVGRVADDMLTGKIELPPAWAAEDSIGLINALQTNVQFHGNDPQRWMKLAEVYLAFEANERAIEALSRAYRINPADENIALRYAQTKFFTNSGSLDVSSRQALEGVLQQNPHHQGAQMLMAMGEARAGNYQNAQAWIMRLRKEIKAKEGDHSVALESLDELSKNIQQQAKAQQNQMQKGGAEHTNVTNNAIQVTVTVNPSIVPLIEANDVLFVTIKSVGSKAPLAVKRLDANQLLGVNSQGLTLTLDDNDAMVQSHTISSAIESNSQLYVTARISKSGQALSQTGDLSAIDQKIRIDQQTSQPLPVNIEISTPVE